MSISPIARQIADAVAPKLADGLVRHRPDFLGLAQGPVEKLAARGVFPVLVRSVPVGTGVAADEFLTHFGGLSVAEIARMVVAHAQAKGHDVHPSVRSATAPSPSPGRTDR